MRDYNHILLKSFGFVVGRRDPDVKPEFEGAWMVVDQPFTTEMLMDGDYWAVVGDDLDALCAEAISFFELVPNQLHDWQGIDPDPLHYVLTQEDDQIAVTFEDDTVVWIEKEDGRIRVHCYRPGQDEPMNVEIYKDRMEVWTDA